jgi:hypothetical protein
VLIVLIALARDASRQKRDADARGAATRARTRAAGGSSDQRDCRSNVLERCRLSLTGTACDARAAPTEDLGSSEGHLQTLPRGSWAAAAVTARSKSRPFHVNDRVVRNKAVGSSAGERGNIGGTVVKVITAPHGSGGTRARPRTLGQRLHGLR